MVKLIGAKITYFKLKQEGKSTEEIETRVMRDFPTLSQDSLKRYRNDAKRLYPDQKNVASPSNDASRNPNTNSDLSDGVPKSVNQEANKEKDHYDVKEFATSVGDTSTPGEAQKMAEMYKNGMAPVEPVRIEFIPKIAKRGFDLILKVPFVKKYLEGWEDKESVNMMFDEMENMIKKRVHASSRNSDFWNVLLATGVVGVSMGSHVVLNKKFDLTEEKAVIGAKAPSAVAQLEQIEKITEESHNAPIGTIQEHLTDGKTVKKIEKPIIISPSTDIVPLQDELEPTIR